MGNTKPYAHCDLLGQAKSDGLLEVGVSIWLFKREGDKSYLLFQKRSANIQNGGFYDSSAGGHVDEGEDILTAALRETKEEIGLGLSPADLRFVCSYMTDKKHITVYLSDRTGKDDILQLNSDEVESVEWVEFSDLDMFIRARVKPPLRELLPHLPVLRYYIENYL